MAAVLKKNGFSCGCLAAGLVVNLLFAARCGASVPFMLLGLICLVAEIVGPGMMLARVFCPDLRQRGAAATLTLIFGTALFALCTVAASYTGLRLLFVLPPVLGLVLAWVCRKRASRQTTAGRTAPIALSLPLCILVGLLLCVQGVAAVRFAHPAAVGVLTPQQDFFWNVGNAESFLLGFPPADLRYSGYALTYHYLTELLAAGVSMACGISCFDALAFLLPPAMLAALVLVLWELGRFLWPSTPWRAQLLPAAVLLLGGLGGVVLLRGSSPFWNLLLLHLATNINSVATAAWLLAAFLLLFGLAAKSGFLWWQRPPALVAFALLCVAKGPMAAVLAAAAICAVLLLMPQLNRPGRLQALAFAVVLLALFLLFYKVLFAAGSGASVSFSSHATLEKGAFAAPLAALHQRSGLLYTLALPLFMLVQCFCMAPIAFPLFVLGAVRALPRVKNQGAVQLCCYALGFGGILAFFLFDHPGMSQMYFAFAALLAMEINAVDALLPLPCRPLQAGAALLCVCSLFTGLCSYGGLLKTGTAILTTPTATAEAKPQYTPVYADEEEALRWLGKAMAANEYFATNRMHTGAAEEGLSNIYSALSGRRAYMESFQYAKTNLGVPESEIATRYQQMSDLFGFDGEADATRAEAICRATNVHWLVYNKTLQGSDAAFVGDGAFRLSFENDRIAIYYYAEK